MGFSDIDKIPNSKYGFSTAIKPWHDATTNEAVYTGGRERGGKTGGRESNEGRRSVDMYTNRTRQKKSVKKRFWTQEEVDRDYSG